MTYYIKREVKSHHKHIQMKQTFWPTSHTEWCQWNLIHSFTTVAHVGKCWYTVNIHLQNIPDTDYWMIASQIHDHALVMVPLWWVPFVTLSNVRITVMLSELPTICTQYLGCSKPWTAVCHSTGFRDMKRASCVTGSPHCLNTETTQKEQSFLCIKVYRFSCIKQMELPL
jgi:hypothetical protein